MVIDRQIGRGPVLDEAINDALPKLYVQALQDNSIEPLAQPEIDITKFEDNESLEFTAEVDVRPEITLPELDGLAVSDEDVDTQVQTLRERFATLNEVDRAAADGDFVVVDLKASHDGEVVEGAEVAGMSYQVGRGGMLEGLDEALAGMNAGDEKTFASNLVGGDQLGLDVEVEVKVSAVKEQELPELDDEFAQTASEFDTADELVADVRVRLERGKRLEQAAAARDAVLEKILDLVEIPLPDGVVDAELKSRRENVQQQLMYAGMTMEQYLEAEEQTLEEFESDLEQRTRDAIAAQFVLDEVAKKEQIGVDQQELSEHLFRRAQQSGQDPNEFAKHMVEHNHIPEMVSEVVRGKALAIVVESAKVVDGSGNHVELKNLRPDGTIGEPEAEAAETEAPEGAGSAEAGEGEDSSEA